ncbi:MAG: hypothetical protein QF491_08130, partial [Alphaproteobacteria bacterium]|nr:hypothetical protein [Alphaproteobacteria bacterium]
MSEITRIAFAPLLPWPAIAVLAAAAAARLAFALWRRADGTWWRALALAAGLAALVNPALVREQRSPLTDVAVVVVDQSISQRIGERRQRSEAALRQIEAELRERPDLDLRVIRAGRGAGGGRLLPDGTHLMGALRRAFNDVPARRVAGAVIISDGQV